MKRTVFGVWAGGGAGEVDACKVLANNRKNASWVSSNLSEGLVVFCTESVVSGAEVVKGFTAFVG